MREYIRPEIKVYTLGLEQGFLIGGSELNDSSGCSCGCYGRDYPQWNAGCYGCPQCGHDNSDNHICK